MLSLNGDVVGEDSQAPYLFDLSGTSVAQGNVLIKAEAFTATTKGSSTATALKLPDEPSLMVISTSFEPSMENKLNNFIKPVINFNDIPLVSPENVPAMFVLDSNYEQITDQQLARIQNYVLAGGHLYYENKYWYWEREALNPQLSNLGIEATGEWSQSIQTIMGAANSIVSGLEYQAPSDYAIFSEIKGLDGEAMAVPLWFSNEDNFSNTVANQVGSAKIIATSGEFSWLPENLTMTVLAKYLDYFGLDSSTKPMSITIGAPEISAIEEANTDVYFTISRMFDDGTDSKVNIKIESENAVAGTDYQALTFDSVSFTSGELTTMVRISLQDDFVADGDKVLSVIISGDNVGDGEEAQSAAHITITDNEHRGLVQFKDTSVSIAENAGTMTVVVERIDGSDDELNFNLTTTDVNAKAGVDYMAINEEVTLTQGQVEFTVTFDIIDNSIYNANKTFSLSLSGEHVADNNMMTVTITNDEAAPEKETNTSSGGGGAGIFIAAFLFLVFGFRTKRDFKNN